MFCVYEQFNPGTRFGKEMVKNLAARGCPLLATSKYATKEDNQERYKSLGWDGCEPMCWTLNEHYDRVMSEEEIVRISKLEMLAELEEFRLIQNHYLLLVATGSKGWDAGKIY